jgi:Zn-dependent peptidase ImmA (M78 family)/transcriptional regulator with XRE-family HTH domain
MERILTFDPRRLTLARWAAGLTRRALAEQVGLSPASITQYEAGNTTPQPQTVAQIGLALGVPRSYFSGGSGRRRSLGEPRSFFRSMRSTRQWERDQADARAEHVYDVVLHVDQFLHLPEVQVPHLRISSEHAARQEVEACAMELRRIWEMPAGPVSHVVRLLEVSGAIVARLQSTNPRLDAFSRWFEERPLVLLWDGKDDKGRSRFDAAHELAHLVMHHEPEPGAVWQERQANAFAAAFLMPAQWILDELPRRAPRLQDWDGLAELRSRWGVSIATLFYRARELGTLTESAFRRSMIRLTDLDLRHHDGDALGAAEQPSLLAEAVGQVMERRGLDLDGLAEELCFSRAQLDDVLGGRPATAHSADPSTKVHQRRRALSAV